MNTLHTSDTMRDPAQPAQSIQSKPTVHRISLTERQIYTILFNSAGILDLDNLSVASTMKAALAKIKQNQK